MAALLEQSTLRAEALAVTAQCTADEAMDTLTRLERAGSVTRLTNRSKAFQLSSEIRSTFESRIRYPTRSRLDAHRELGPAYLDAAPQIGREEAVDLLGLTPTSASRILASLARAGDLVPVASTRGAGVRYRRASH